MPSDINPRERKTQRQVVRFFQDELGYRYLGDWKDRPGNSNVEEDLVRAFLHKQNYTQPVIEKALFELQQMGRDRSGSLYEGNKAFYSALRYGLKIKPSAEEHHQTVLVIDWDHPEHNDFALIEEVSIKGLEHSKRPDLVLYVNGLAVGVIELKRSGVNVGEGIRQNLGNQEDHFIRPFFNTIQLVMAANTSQGVRYGTTGTPAKYYLTWKEEDPQDRPLLQRHLYQLCRKERLLDLMRDFVLYDAGVKKVCRPHQYFGIQAAKPYVRERRGGILWHTQGSGKSLTMVWLARWIRENITDARVLVITDRKELDSQIVGVFSDAGDQMQRASSGADLVDLLNKNEHPLICSLVHKFGRGGDDDEQSRAQSMEKFIQQIRDSLPPGFSAKGNIYVFVDECHRTQSGRLHTAMKTLLPKGTFIGFTGTPLLKKDKKRSIEVFGPYIHTYKFDEAVEDGVVLDLRYEARDVEQYLADAKKVDDWFAAKTRGLNDYQKQALKQRWGTMQKVLSSRDRLSQIVRDIITDFGLRPRLKDERGTAMLVASSIYQACKYYELFQQSGFTKCAVVTSYQPHINDIKGESIGEAAQTEAREQYEIYQQMLNKKDAETHEQEVKKLFIEQPEQMRLLIVVDKLLTGFDAPPATYLYIDKQMRDHGLFQAICRVNRLHDETKEYGYIVDYKDLFANLQNSIHDYTSEAFEGYDEADVEGLLNDRLEEERERLEDTLEALRALIEPVHPKEDDPLRRFFCGDSSEPEELQEREERRVNLYKLVASLVRAYAHLKNDMPEAGYTPGQAQAIEEEVTWFVDLRQVIKIASGEHLDLKAYEADMRQLIDMYIGAYNSRTTSTLEDFGLVELLVEKGVGVVDDMPKGVKGNKNAVSETIENNLRRVIIEQQATNPKYYERMSLLLDELIRQRREEAWAYEAYLQKLVDLANQVKKPTEGSKYPEGINTPAKQALYDNLEEDAKLTVVLDEQVRYVKRDGWRHNSMKRRQVVQAIKKVLRRVITDEEALEVETKRILELIKSQQEY